MKWHPVMSSLSAVSLCLLGQSVLVFNTVTSISMLRMPKLFNLSFLILKPSWLLTYPAFLWALQFFTVCHTPRGLCFLNACARKYLQSILFLGSFVVVCSLMCLLICSFVSSHPATGCYGRWVVGGSAATASGRRCGRQHCTRLAEVALLLVTYCNREFIVCSYDKLKMSYICCAETMQQWSCFR